MTLLQVTILPSSADGLLALSSSWTASANPVNLYVECVGGGGGGGGASVNGIGGGGGAGAYSAQFIESASGAFSCSVGGLGIGGLGPAGALDQNTGSAGGGTFFGGNAGGAVVAGGGAGGRGSAAPEGGAGGLVSGGEGDFTHAGGDGSTGFRYADRQLNSHAQSGNGAAGFLGGGAPGINSDHQNQPSVRDGIAVGAGGGGANSDRGGSGSAGMIRIWEYSG